MTELQTFFMFSGWIVALAMCIWVVLVWKDYQNQKQIVDTLVNGDTKNHGKTRE